MKNKPFFSFVIPTYNRSKDLEKAIKSILRQDFLDYEIIITDNSSNTKSEKTCKKFNDKRIHYHRNKKNIGSPFNIYKGISYAAGKYIFLLGDDDLLLNKDLLKNARREITSNKIDYLRLRYLYVTDQKKLFSPFDFENLHDLKITNKAKNIEIYRFLYNSKFQFISGNIFRNKKIKIDEMENPDSSIKQVNEFFIKYLFSACKKRGGQVDQENIIVAAWSNYENGGSHFYDVEEGKTYFEKGNHFFFENLSKKEQNLWLKEETEMNIMLLPSIKYYSNNRNLYLHLKRMLDLNKKLRFNPKVFIMSLIAFLMPPFIWLNLRKIFHKKKIINNEKIKKEFYSLLKDLK